MPRTTGPACEPTSPLSYGYRGGMQQAGLHDGVSCTKVASEFCKLAAVGSIPTDSTKKLASGAGETVTRRVRIAEKPGAAPGFPTFYQLNGSGGDS